MRRTVLAAILTGIAAGPALAASQPTDIPLAGGSFKPHQGILDLGLPAGSGDATFSGHALVQLDHPLTRAVEDVLAGIGVRFLSHVHERTFLVRVQAKGSKLDRVIARYGAAIARIPPKLKLARTVPSWAARPGRNDFLIRFHDDVTDQGASNAFAAARIKATRSRRCPCWTAQLTLQDAEALAVLDAVRYIEPDDRTIVPFTHELRPAVGADALQGFTGTDTAYGFDGLSGDGVTIGVLDVGVASPEHHAYWAMESCGSAGCTSRYSAFGTPPHLHAAWLAGIIGANGVDTPSSCGGGWNLHGIAPRAKMFGMNATNSEFANFKEAIVDHGADLTNNSYGASLLNYASFAADDDELVWGGVELDGVAIPPRPGIWAAGNSGSDTTEIGSADNGYFGIHNPQKNGIVVGGSLLDWSSTPMTSLVRWEGSSIGPTLDGRLKPDLMAPACKVVAEDGSHDAFIRTTVLVNGTYSPSDAYGSTGKCGTSFSAAVVSGIAGLLIEEWRSIHGATSRPRASTLKAILIQGAHDMTETSRGPVSGATQVPIEAFPGPDYATGYGEVDGEASRDVIAQERVIEDQVLVVDETKSYRITVPAGTTDTPAPKRLRVTLAWDDPKAGDTGADTKKLENDLDLTVVGPSGGSAITHFPWVLPTLTPPVLGANRTIVPPELAGPTRGPDHLNNVEQVEIDTPVPGTYEIRVNAYALSFAYPQPFALASDLPFDAAIEFPLFNATLGRKTFLDLGLANPTVAALLAARGDAKVIVVPARPACTDAAPCPACGRYGDCPPIQLDLEGIPPDWQVKLVDGTGRKLTSKPHRDDRGWSLTMQRRPGVTAFLVLNPPRKIVPHPQDRERIRLVPSRAK